MTELTQLSLFDVREALKKHECTATEVVQAHVEAMNELKGLNAYSAMTAELALQDAAEADRHLSNGTARDLEGVPFAVKDLFCTRGVKSTSSSHILDGFEPTYESTVSDRLRQGAGGIMLGKTNMDEFAMGSANITSYDGPVRNPWTPAGEPDAWVVPGGSSGGSAAAVAARLCYGALGSDTGGSIRQPAAFTGTVGIKPTYGRCSRYGMISFASSLDQAGVITRSVQDSAIMLKAICGHDHWDSTSYNGDVPDFEALLNGDVSGKVIGIPKEYRMDGTPEDIVKLWDQGIKWLEDAGATTREVTLPHTKYALPAYYIVAPAEASSNLARYDGVRYGLRVMDAGDSLDDMYEKTRAAGFGDEVKRRIMIGTYVLSAGYYDAYYRKAQQIRTLIARDFEAVFEDVDAILAPTTPSAAFKKGEKMDDPVAMFLNDVFTVPSSMAGLPAMSVPAGLSANGLPLGLQVIGKAFDEAQVLNVGRALEMAAKFEAQPAMLGGGLAEAA